MCFCPLLTLPSEDCILLLHYVPLTLLSWVLFEAFPHSISSEPSFLWSELREICVHGLLSGVHRFPPLLIQETEGHQCICACVWFQEKEEKKKKAPAAKFMQPKNHSVWMYDTKWVKILQLGQHGNEFISNSQPTKLLVFACAAVPASVWNLMYLKRKKNSRATFG